MPTPSDPSADHLQELLEKYEQGACSPAEKKWLEDWYGSLDLPVARDPSTPTDEASLVQIWQGLQAATLTPKKIGWRSGLRIAAAVIPFILLGSLLFYKYRMAAGPGKHDPLRFNQIATTARQVKKFILPDGSAVWLNAASSLRFSEDMQSDSVRRVFLPEGEAFFDVRQDAARPFVIQTAGGLRVRVLGTSFDLRSYANDMRVSVAMATGKVQVLIDSAGVSREQVLSAGQGLSVDKSTLRIVAYTPNLHATGGWRSGQLEFDNATLAEMAHGLERWYNRPVLVRSGRGNAADRYNARFDKGASLKEVLRLLSITNGLQYKFAGDSVWISNK